MSKKNIPNNRLKNQSEKENTTRIPETSLKQNPFSIRNGLIICLLLTLIALLPAFQAGFLFWDDPDYVMNNLSIRSFNNLSEILTTPIQGNYHPLTMLSLACNYAISGDDAGSYHIVNLILHLINVWLVFIFVYKLTKEKIWIAFISALLFGIHPLHVESVIWVSERKDVLYSCFFLLGLISYLKYLEKKSYLQLLKVLVFFCLSLLSKPAAVVFPLVLIAIDYLIGRKDFLKTMLEKTPFLILSLVMGLLTLHSQELQGATSFSNVFPAHFRFFFGFYGILMYFINTIFPFQLCAFYPYPSLNTSLPIAYYLAVIFTIALGFVFVWAHKRNKLLAFSILFYIINLILVLQFKPVGSAIIADRYTYMPLIGIFIIIGYFIQKLADKYNAKLPFFTIVLISIVSLSLVALSYKQATTWKDTASLWDQAIKVNQSSRAYSNRGLEYKKEGNISAALELYNKAIQINKIEKDALLNRGNIYFDSGQDELAMKDYRSAYALKQDDPVLLNNMASLYGRKGMLDSCLYYVNASIKINANRHESYLTRSLCYDQMQRYAEAISDLKMANQLNPTDALMSDIGLDYQRLSNYEESLVWFGKALAKNPKAGLHYLRRSYTYFRLGNKLQALQDADQAKNLGTTVPQDYYESLK